MENINRPKIIKTSSETIVDTLLDLNKSCVEDIINILEDKSTEDLKYILTNNVLNISSVIQLDDQRFYDCFPKGSSAVKYSTKILFLQAAAYSILNGYGLCYNSKRRIISDIVTTSYNIVDAMFDLDHSRYYTEGVILALEDESEEDLYEILEHGISANIIKEAGAAIDKTKELFLQSAAFCLLTKRYPSL